MYHAHLSKVQNVKYIKSKDSRYCIAFKLIHVAFVPPLKGILKQNVTQLQTYNHLILRSLYLDIIVLRRGQIMNVNLLFYCYQKHK